MDNNMINGYELNSAKLKTIWLFRVISDNWGDDLIASLIKKKIYNHLPYIEVREVSVKEKVTPEMIADINRSVGVILGGSGLFVNYPTLASGFYWNCAPGLFEKIDVPIFIIGVGTNDNYQLSNYGALTQQTKASIKRLLDKSSLIWVRDGNTRNQIKKLTEKEVINGCCPSIITFREYGGYTNLGYSNVAATSVSFGMHGRYVEYKWKELISFYVKVISSILMLTDNIIYHVKHRDVDQDAYNYVKTILSKEYSSRYLFIELYDTRQQLNIYSNCTTNISMYLHSAIISAGAGVPVQMIGYDVKCESFYDDVASKNDHTSYQSLEGQLNDQLVITNLKEIIKNPYQIRWHNREYINTDVCDKIDALFREIVKVIIQGN